MLRVYAESAGLQDWNGLFNFTMIQFVRVVERWVYKIDILVNHSLIQKSAPFSKFTDRP